MHQIASVICGDHGKVSDVEIRVVLELGEVGDDVFLDELETFGGGDCWLVLREVLEGAVVWELAEGGDEDIVGLCDVEAYVWDLVLDEFGDHWEDGLFNDLHVDCWGEGGDCKTGCHAVQVVSLIAHGHDFGYNRLSRPLDAKDFCEFLEVESGGLTNAEDGVAQPGHAEISELLVEELDAQLGGEKRDVLDDGETDTPLLILGELNNCWKQRL